MNQDLSSLIAEVRKVFKQEVTTFVKELITELNIELNVCKNELSKVKLELENLKRNKETESIANHAAEFYTSIQQQLSIVERPNWLSLEILEEKTIIPVQPITHDIGSNKDKIMEVLCDMIQNEYCDVVDTSKNGIIGNIKPYFTLFPKTIDASNLIKKSTPTKGIIPLCLGFIEGKCLFDSSSGEKIINLSIDDKGKALFYAYKVLELFPSLLHCMVTLTNYEQIIFMKANRAFRGGLKLNIGSPNLFSYLITKLLNKMITLLRMGGVICTQC